MNPDLVKRMAALSMLRLNPGEEASLSAAFDQLVAFAGRLEAGDAAPSDFTPGSSVPAPGQGPRPDLPGESLPTQAVLQNAKTVCAGCITVPKTFE